MPRRLHLSRLTRSCVAAIIGASAWSTSPLALAQTAAAPPAAAPSQKPPCVPASSYMLGYDCELFPLPAAAAGAQGAAPVPAAATVPAAAPVPAVVPAPAVGPVPAISPAVAAVPVFDAPAAVPSAESASAAVTPVPAPPPDSSPGGSPSHAPAYVAFAVGAGGVGMTVVFGILALQTKSTLTGECFSGNACPPSASSDVSTLKTDGILADVGLGLAVVGVGLGAILFATEHGSSSTTGGRHIEPWIGLGAGGLKGAF